ncbi:MAG: RdgB/HAM1 family non-canonical purine NTP pyrophosphatase [Candidatus Hydrogenedentes bacterium]|nr:RdgB/HAM1 family non-canonical purine NTP pyrophosphatase [Candidatus Hydrogenedentota bacterium]
MPDNVLLIATGNAHKLDEIRSFLKGVAWRIAGLDEFPPCNAPAETGTTFKENATIKALAYAAQFKVACVADDSGLEVDALGGEPGVRSARYAGENATASDNNAKLLLALKATPDVQRTARFVCYCALALPGKDIHIETGAVEGHIAHQERGANGFGYDPLFIPNGYNETFGVLGPDVKAAISHRAKAFRKLRAHLEPATQ